MLLSCLNCSSPKPAWFEENSTRVFCNNTCQKTYYSVISGQPKQQTGDSAEKTMEKIPKKLRSLSFIELITERNENEISKAIIDDEYLFIPFLLRKFKKPLTDQEKEDAEDFLSVVNYSQLQKWFLQGVFNIDSTLDMDQIEQALNYPVYDPSYDGQFALKEAIYNNNSDLVIRLLKDTRVKPTSSVLTYASDRNIDPEIWSILLSDERAIPTQYLFRNIFEKSETQNVKMLMIGRHPAFKMDNDFLIQLYEQSFRNLNNDNIEKFLILKELFGIPKEIMHIYGAIATFCLIVEKELDGHNKSDVRDKLSKLVRNLMIIKFYDNDDE